MGGRLDVESSGGRFDPWQSWCQVVLEQDAVCQIAAGVTSLVCKETFMLFTCLRAFINGGHLTQTN